MSSQGSDTSSGSQRSRSRTRRQNHDSLFNLPPQNRIQQAEDTCTQVATQVVTPIATQVTTQVDSQVPHRPVANSPALECKEFKEDNQHHRYPQREYSNDTLLVDIPFQDLGILCDLVPTRKHIKQTQPQ